MYVYATDMGFPAQNSSNEAKVVIRVTHNNHPPKFDRRLYTKSVAETLPIDGSVFKMNANDRDSAVSYCCFVLYKGWSYMFVEISLKTDCYKLHACTPACVHVCTCVCAGIYIYVE